MDNSISNNYPLISVAMATYNGEKYLAEQLDSILNQDYPNIEIVIVDDCSSDNTWEILNTYAVNYNNIRIYKNKFNLGFVKNFQKAIYATNGDYIALSDQDDKWLPHKLSTLMKEIGDNWLIHSNALLIDQHENLISFDLDKDKPRSRRFYPQILIDNIVTGCTILFQKKYLIKYLPIPNGFHFHDHYLGIISSYFKKIKYLQEPLILYRQHSANTVGIEVPNYRKWLKNIQNNNTHLLKNLLIFKNDNDLKFAIKLQHSLVKHKPPSFQLSIWIIKNFGLRRLIGILTKSLMGEKVASILYSSSIKIRK